MEVHNNIQKGFTLIELLIVISIISILSLTAIGSYAGQKESSLLKLGTSTVLSDLSSARDSMGHGNYDNEERIKSIRKKLAGEKDVEIGENFIAKCVGYEFTKDGVFDFTLDYNGKKVWNPIFERFDFNGCDDVKNRHIGDYKLESKINIVSIKKNGADIDRFLVVYEPPFGDVFYSFNANSANLVVGDLEVEKLEKNKIDIVVDPTIGKIEKVVEDSNDVIGDIPVAKIEMSRKNIIEKAKIYEINAAKQKNPLMNSDEVVVEFMYGDGSRTTKNRYIKFDITNDEVSME